MSDVLDDDLVTLFRDGDVDAFDTLFDRYRAPVYSFARMMLGRMDGADDVLQETFLAVARTAQRYQARGRFRPWLFRITRNLCLNRIESDRVRRQVIPPAGLVAEPPAAQASPAEQAERDEEMAALHRRIAELPERQREAIVLYAFEQMSYRDIGETLGVPINTVKTLIHRARAALASALEREQGV